MNKLSTYGKIYLAQMKGETLMDYISDLWKAIIAFFEEIYEVIKSLVEKEEK